MNLRLVDTDRCGGVPEYLGFYNRTCLTGRETPSAGPVLRSANSSWINWKVYQEGDHVVGGEFDGMTTYKLKTYRPSNTSNSLQCHGYIKPYYNPDLGCKEERLRLKKEVAYTVAYPWVFEPVPGKNDTFYLVAFTRGKGCKRYLSAAPDCGTKSLRLYGEKKGERSQWKTETFATVLPVIG